MNKKYFFPNCVLGVKVSYIMPLPLLSLDSLIKQKRRVFYANMVKIQDEETQLKGRVSIIWMANQEFGMDRTVTWELGRLFAALPVRISATHICIPAGERNFVHGSVVALLIYAVGSLMRLRLKSHFGKFGGEGACAYSACRLASCKRQLHNNTHHVSMYSLAGAKNDDQVLRWN